MDYIVGLARNARLAELSAHLAERAASGNAADGRHRRVFGWIYHAARSWDTGRSVIAKAEHGAKGANPRYVVTSLHGDARDLYERICCARGEMENRIKEQQLGLSAGRTRGGPTNCGCC